MQERLLDKCNNMKHHHCKIYFLLAISRGIVHSVNVSSWNIRLQNTNLNTGGCCQSFRNY